MKAINQQKAREIRRERNSELVRRIQNGEKLSSFSSVDSWYPPRPIAEKDPQAINQLYGTSVDERLRRSGRPNDGKNDKNRQGAGFKPLRLA